MCTDAQLHSEIRNITDEILLDGRGDYIKKELTLRWYRYMKIYRTKDTLGDMMDTSKDYYSVFNKKGGWMNMAYVMLGVGAVTVAVALLGFIGVQKETIFLLLTHIVLLMIIIMLQIASVLIIIRRGNEVKDLRQIINAKSLFEINFKFEEKFIFFVFSLSFSTLVLVMSVGITLARQMRSGKEKRMEPV